jgi:hypothetical protein
MPGWLTKLRVAICFLNDFTMAKHREKDYSGSNRRQWARLSPADIPFLKSVAFHQGSEVQVVDISAGGMLLETEVRMQPNMRVQLKIETSTGSFKIEGNVLRSWIASLQGAPRYRSAIAFQHPIHMLLDNIKAKDTEQAKVALQETEKIESLPTEGVPSLPSIPDGLEANGKQATLTLIAEGSNGFSLNETFILNEW